MKLGIRGYDIGKFIPEVLSARIKQFGFDGVQLVVNKSLIDSSNQTLILNHQNAKRITSSFFEQHVEIAMLDASFNPLHPNSEVVNRGIENFMQYMRCSSTLGCPYVGTETGSINGDQWTFSVANHSEESFQKVVEIFKKILDYAEEFDCYLVVEPSYSHAIYSLDRLQQLLKVLASDRVYITIDIMNLLHMGNYRQYFAILADALDRFDSKIKIFHFRNFEVINQQLIPVGLDQGYMDYEAIIALLSTLPHSFYCIMEGVKGDQILPSYSYVRRILRKY